MKCPKCDYLGFETADRCKNCGYDFSLLAAPEPELADLSLREPELPARDLPSLPLFARAAADDDAPLIKLPATPRPPLSVRRAPEPPRPRPAPRPPRPAYRSPWSRREDAQPFEPELALHFPEDADGIGLQPDVPEARLNPPRQGYGGQEPDTASAQEATPAPPRYVERRSQAAGPAPASPVARRVAAALVDLAILFAVDAAVLYFTLRMAGLTMGEWRLLPAIPMLAFLTLLKLGYFCAFTSAGGQTIGKMAARIQVVADDDTPLRPTRAARRVLAGALSIVAFGLGFIPALIGPDRRPLHDRVARTRVVART